MTNLDQLYSPPKAPPAPAAMPSYDIGDALVRAEFGGIWIRLLAHSIDQVIIMGLGFCLAMIDRIVRGAAADGTEPGAAALTMITGAIASYALFALSEGIGGGTIGKTICGLEVCKERLEKCTIGAGLLRGIGLYFDLLICGIPGITSIQGSRLKQRYGDKWAHTIVVRSRSVPPPAANQRALGILVGLTAWTVVTLVPMVVGWIS